MRELKAREDNKSNLFKLFPDEGPYRRELYPKHLAFFRAGKIHQDRMFLAANRIGKTLAALFEDSLHLTGLYPPWWEGQVFPGPIKAWVSSVTAKDTRDIMQVELFGEKEELGTGLIPESTIIRTTPKHGLSDAFDLVYIRHVSGGISVLQHKSFDQGVEAFKGRKIDLIPSRRGAIARDSHRMLRPHHDDPRPRPDYRDAPRRAHRTDRQLYKNLRQPRGPSDSVNCWHGTPESLSQRMTPKKYRRSPSRPTRVEGA